VICAWCRDFAFSAYIFALAGFSSESSVRESLLESYLPAVREDRARKYMRPASFRLELPPTTQHLAALANHVRVKHVQRCQRVSPCANIRVLL
jgi:hypothetical protein